MNADTTRLDYQHVPTGPPVSPSDAESSAQAQAYERAVDVILDDCFLSMGQAVGLRATFDYDAVVWLRARFREKFLAALHRNGDRWLEDRANVTAVCGMFAERAVRYAGGAASVDLDAVRKAAADVERHCQMHASRRSQSDASTAMIAGYWCIWDPK